MLKIFRENSSVSLRTIRRAELAEQGKPSGVR
jgi:hypothetical protein